MALLEIHDSLPPPARDLEMSVVLCGSFRRDAAGLADIHAELSRFFRVLSPQAVDFVDPTAAFVRLSSETGESDLDIEARHLDAMTAADFVWLHAPDGYVGSSASMELGYANALGIPIFSPMVPSESVLAGSVYVMERPSLITRNTLFQVGRPGRGLQRLQRYYEATAARRGWDEESTLKTFELLQGEISELAQAIEMKAKGTTPAEDPDSDVAAELADVQLYLIHLANRLGLRIDTAVSEKELLNSRRFESQSSVA
jgi:dCTP diphosphatase